MVAENENADSKSAGADAASSEPEASHSSGKVEASEAPEAGAAESSSQTENSSSAPSSLEEKVKKGAKNYKGYLMKVGKLMMMLAILGSLLIGFATYMISSTFNNIFQKLEHPTE